MEEVYNGAPIRYFTPPNASKIAPLVIDEGKMPNVFDREIDQVREFFEKKGYTVEIGESAYSSAQEGHVAGSKPPAGGKVPSGTTVTLFPSKGVRNVPSVPQPTPTETEGAVPDPTQAPDPTGEIPEGGSDDQPEGEQPAPTTTNAGEPQETDPGPTTTTDVTPTNVTKTTTTTDGPGVEGDAPEDGDAEGPEATTPQPTPTPTPNPAPTPTGLAPPEDN